MTPDESGLRCACGCEFLGSREAADILGLSVGGVRNLASQGGMPEPVGRISGHSPVWLAADIEQLAAERRANGKSRPRKSQQTDVVKRTPPVVVHEGFMAEARERSEALDRSQTEARSELLKILDSKLADDRSPSVALEALVPTSRTETENQPQTELQTDQPTSYPSSGTSNAEPIAEPEHQSLGLEMDGRRYIGRCSCGWSTPRMASEKGATTRLELHLA